MCFASSVVEAHKKLFIANAGGATTSANSHNNNRSSHSGVNSSNGGNGSGSGGIGCGGAAGHDKRDSLSTSAKGLRSDKHRGSSSASGSGNSLKNAKMSRSKTRIQTEVCGDCGASGEL